MTKQKEENKQINQESTQESSIKSKKVAALKRLITVLLLGWCVILLGWCVWGSIEVAVAIEGHLNRTDELLLAYLVIFLITIVSCHSALCIFWEKARKKSSILKWELIVLFLLMACFPLIFTIISAVMAEGDYNISSFLMRLSEVFLYCRKLMFITFSAVIILSAALCVFLKEFRKRGLFIFYFILSGVVIAMGYVLDYVTENEVSSRMVCCAYTVVPVSGMKRKKKSKSVENGAEDDKAE